MNDESPVQSLQFIFINHVIAPKYIPPANTFKICRNAGLKVLNYVGTA